MNFKPYFIRDEAGHIWCLTPHKYRALLRDVKAKAKQVHPKYYGAKIAAEDWEELREANPAPTFDHQNSPKSVSS